MKVAILRHYDITEETYRQRFWSAVRSNDETHHDLAIHLGDLATKWLKGVNTVELVKEAVIQEQLLNTLTPAIRVWVKERKPTTALEAGQLADDYIEARKQTTKDDQPTGLKPSTKDDRVTSLWGTSTHQGQATFQTRTEVWRLIYSKLLQLWKTGACGFKVP